MTAERGWADPALDKITLPITRETTISLHSYGRVQIVQFGVPRFTPLNTSGGLAPS